MGKGDRRPPWRGDGERSYSWWSGAWKVSPKAKGKHEKTLKTSAFPAYDANWVSAAGIAEVQGARQPKPVTGNLVTDVQAAVNTARRLDQKLAKLRAETIKLSQSWNEYVTQETQAYNKEKSRHESDQRRIAAEIQDLEQQQMAAYYQVRHVASTSGKDSEVPSPAPVTDLESQLAIDAMDIADGWTDESLGADLARIMAATVPAPGLAPSPGPPTFTPQRPTNAVPRMPVGHSGPAPSPAENGEGKPGLLHAPGADPYLVSPGMAHFGMPPATPPAASRTFGGGAAPGNGDVLPVVAPVDIAGMKTRLSLSEREIVTSKAGDKAGPGPFRACTSSCARLRWGRSSSRPPGHWAEYPWWVDLRRRGARCYCCAGFSGVGQPGVSYFVTARPLRLDPRQQTRLCLWVHRLAGRVRSAASLGKLPVSEYPFGQCVPLGQDACAVRGVQRFHCGSSLREDVIFLAGLPIMSAPRRLCAFPCLALPLPWALVVDWAGLGLLPPSPFVDFMLRSSRHSPFSYLFFSPSWLPVCKERARDTSVAVGCPPLPTGASFGLDRDAPSLCLPPSFSPRGLSGLGPSLGGFWDFPGSCFVSGRPADMQGVVAYSYGADLYCLTPGARKRHIRR